jgi:hypothetical protein
MVCQDIPPQDLLHYVVVLGLLSSNGGVSLTKRLTSRRTWDVNSWASDWHVHRREFGRVCVSTRPEVIPTADLSSGHFPSPCK